VKQVTELGFGLLFAFAGAAWADDDFDQPEDTTAIIEETSDSTHTEGALSPSDFLSLPLHSLQDLIGIEAGAAEMWPHRRFLAQPYPLVGSRPVRQSVSAQEVDIRGGRPYETTWYLHGVPINDPISGQITFNVSPLAVSSLRYAPSGLPVNFGSSNSGVSILTPSGGNRYSGMIELVTDEVVGSDYGQNWYTASLSGPLPALKKGTFFGLVERRWLGDRNPSALTDKSLLKSPNRLPGNWLDGLSFNAHVTYPVSPDIALTFTADGSREEWSEYVHEYLFNIEHTPYHKDDNLLLSGKMDHRLTPKVSYSLGVSHFRTERFTGDGKHREDLMAYSRLNGNYGAYGEMYDLFWYADDPSTPVQTMDRTVYTGWAFEDDVPVPTESAVYSLVLSGDEGHVYENYLKHKSVSLQFDGTVAYKPLGSHTVEAGVSYQRMTIRYLQHHEPVYAWIPYSHYDANRYGYDILGNESDSEGWRSEARHPLRLAVFAQHSFEYQRFHITSGLRLDRFDYDALQPRNRANPLNPDSLGWPGYPPGGYTSTIIDRPDLEEAAAQTRFSPRLSVRYAPDDNTDVGFNFGVFYQNPPLENVYVGWEFYERQIQGAGYLTTQGMQDPIPEKTVSYELTARREINPGLSAQGTLYYRSSSDILGTVRYPSFPLYHFAFENMHDRIDKGFEVGLQVHPESYLTFGVTFVLRKSEITGLVSEFYAPHEFKHSYTYPVDHDQPHRLVCKGELRLKDQEGFRIGQVYPLENARVTLIFEAAGGLPYTAIPVGYQGIAGMWWVGSDDYYNSSRWASASVLNLRIERKVRIGDLFLTPFLWIENLFDRQNVTNVWRATGQPDNDGYLGTAGGREFVEAFPTPNDYGLTGEDAYLMLVQYPQNVGHPRMFYFGIRAAF